MDELEAAIDRLGALPLKRYCQITGESPNTIYQRKFKHIWHEGIELFRPTGGDWWVNLAAVRAWVTGQGDAAELADVTKKLKELVRRESQRYAT